MAFTFKGWVWKLFPPKWQQDDSYKDYRNKGVLQRYVENLEVEVDEEIYPFILNFLDIYDVFQADSKFIPYLSYMLGSPISVQNNLAIYRKILAYAVEIYKIKGTFDSYTLLFNIFGMEVIIKEAVPKRGLHYDEGFHYDDGNHYDQKCENCSCYYIVYKPLTEPDNTLNIDLTVSQAVMDLVNNIICFIQPINAQMCGVYRKVTFSDDLPIEFEDSGFTDIPGRKKFFRSIAEIPGDINVNNPHISVADAATAYNAGSTIFDLDLIRDEYNDTPFGMGWMYFADSEGFVNRRIRYHGLFFNDNASFQTFIEQFFNTPLVPGDDPHYDEILQRGGDLEFIMDPANSAYIGTSVYSGPIDTSIAVLQRIDGRAYTGCPNPEYPIVVYDASGNIPLGIAHTKQEYCDIWNSYIYNKSRCYLTPEPINGCEFTTHIMKPPGMAVSSLPFVFGEPISADFNPGDFGPDFG